MNSGRLVISILLVVVWAGFAGGVPPDGDIEGPHGNIPGFPENSCYVCHDIVPGATGRDAVLMPNETCFGCHTDGPTYGEDDPAIVDRPHATPVGNHSSHVTGTQRFVYGEFDAAWPYPEFEQQIHCTTCHDPHQTFDPADPNPSTQNVMYIRDHTDDWQVTLSFLVELMPTKLIRVIDNTGPEPVEFVKEVDQAIVYTGPGDLADGIGMLAAETDVCEVCHTLTDHHQVDDTAPGGQSHFDGEDCTACHEHTTGFAIGGFQPLTGPHALFGDPNCGACHDEPTFPGGAGNPDGLASVFCAGCHDPVAVANLHSHTVTGTDRFEYAMECDACHDQHGWAVDNIEGTTNVKYVKARITEQIEVVDNTQGGQLVSKTIDSDIVFTGPGDFIDGDGIYTEDVCSTCHTLTSHHQNDGSAPGGQSHYDGQDCTACHEHANGFGQVFSGVHPQAVTDCSNCHLNADGDPDLVLVHGDACDVCHVSGPPATFLGPYGAWNGECDHCHNPTVAQTGYMETPTRGHRCVVCHGEQRATGNTRSWHWSHAKDANCVVCHGFIPDLGTEVGSGNRDICFVCHDSGSGSLEQIHEPHTSSAGLSCLECHGGVRPPIDAFYGSPVGGSDRVCDLCHGNENGSPREIHEHHTDDRVDCGSCHLDATLQDDREPMPPIDDLRRALVDRGGRQECYLCHDNQNGGSTSIHRKHGGQWVWCYSCHEPDDDWPSGGSGPVTEPAESCALCHSGHTYTDERPFDIHRRHADQLKCYTCHQTQPPLANWPPEWLGGQAVAVDEPRTPERVITETALGAHPNPFNPRTEIVFEIPRPALVTVAVYDLQGKLVADLVRGEHRAAGTHAVLFEPRAASGIYFVHLRAGAETRTTKIVLLK